MDRRWVRTLMWMALIGATASLLKTGLDILMVRTTGADKSLYLQVTAFLVHGHTNMHGIGDTLHALLSDALLGSILGVMSAYVYRITPERFWAPAAIFMGLLLWLGSLTIGNILRIIPSTDTTPANLTTHLVAQIAFALLVYWGAQYAVSHDEKSYV